jgi:hypothetical protein
MVHDVSTAVNVLHLGHEPEQAAMLCIALGRVAGLDGGLVVKVFEALAVKCEAAGACVVNAVAQWIPATHCLFQATDLPSWGTHCLFQATPLPTVGRAAAWNGQSAGVHGRHCDFLHMGQQQRI